MFVPNRCFQSHRSPKDFERFRAVFIISNSPNRIPISADFSYKASKSHHCESVLNKKLTFKLTPEEPESFEPTRGRHHSWRTSFPMIRLGHKARPRPRACSGMATAKTKAAEGLVH